MKKSFVLFLFAVVSACAQEQVLDFGPRGRLTLYLIGDWKVTTINMAGKYELTMTPKNESLNASCSIAVSFPEVDRYDTKARLKLRVEADAHGYIEQSVERKAYGKEFNLTVGYGFYCSFTDPNLRGNKPAPPGEYKVISVGKIRITPEILMDVQMMADGFNHETYQQLLGAIEGMEYKPGRGR